jgi:H+/gluconate symporter-like permease
MTFDEITGWCSIIGLVVSIISLFIVGSIYVKVTNKKNSQSNETKSLINTGAISQSNNSNQ